MKERRDRGATHISCENVDELEAGKTLVGIRRVGRLGLEAIEENLRERYKAKKKVAQSAIDDAGDDLDMLT